MKNEVLKKIIRYKFNISVVLVSFALLFYSIDPFKVINIELLQEIIGVEPFNIEKIIMFQLSLMLLIIIIFVIANDDVENKRFNLNRIISILLVLVISVILFLVFV